MGKKLVILIVVAILIIGLGVGGYFAWQKLKEIGPLMLEELGEAIVKKATQLVLQVVLPEIEPLSNPLEKMPDVNPVSRANPFKKIRINPFAP